MSMVRKSSQEDHFSEFETWYKGIERLLHGLYGNLSRVSGGNLDFLVHSSIPWFHAWQHWHHSLGHEQEQHCRNFHRQFPLSPRICLPTLIKYATPAASCTLKRLSWLRRCLMEVEALIYSGSVLRDPANLANEVVQYIRKLNA